MSLLHAPLSCEQRGSEEVLREIRANLLECKVCFEKLGVLQKERRPQNLACGHVLCVECLTSLSCPLLQTVQCPFCRNVCSAAETSDCFPLIDLSELLLPPPPGSRQRPAPRCLSRAGGLASGALRLRSAFGGWGTLLSPTGVAVFGSSGAVAVVHDGSQRVAVFSHRGKWLHGFGCKEGTPDSVSHPLGVAVAPSGHVVVTDAGDCALKVFTSRGHGVVTVRDSFQLPWGVDIDGRGRILVTDAQAGTLSQVVVDFARCLTVLNQVACKGLHCPKSVASCPVTGNVVVVESAESGQGCRLRVFSSQLAVLAQIDTFGLSLASQMPLCISAVAFDREGDMIVANSGLGEIWSLGKSQNNGVLTPLVSQGLVYPVGLKVTLDNTLIVLDSGDHAVKMYEACAGLTRIQQ